jgi:thiol-disulfide isomerase/thioredoxin
MDRNLYERANDCRWWSLNSYFREVLEDYSQEKEQSVKYILKYINDLYSVYSNLIVFDKTGKVISVSNEKYDFLVGKVLAQEWIEKSLSLSDTSKYCVSKFEKTTLYDNKSTYIYCSAIRSLKDDKNIIGGIATIFDSSLQFYTMLEEILPKDAYGDKQKGVYAFFTNKNREIIATTNTNFEVNSYLDIDDTFFNLKNGEVFNSLGKKYTLIDFWFSNCAPCLQQLPAYKKIYEKKDEILSEQELNEKINRINSVSGAKENVSEILEKEKFRKRITIHWRKSLFNILYKTTTLSNICGTFVPKLGEQLWKQRIHSYHLQASKYKDEQLTTRCWKPFAKVN